MAGVDAIIGGLAGGLVGSAAGESTRPIFKDWSDAQRMFLLVGIIFLLFLWFVIMPGRAKNKARRVT